MNRRIMLGVLMATGAAISPCICAAQAAGKSGAAAAGNEVTGLAEVVVTASKRSESLQKMAAAVSVVSGDKMESAGIVDSTQLSKLVPSLVIGRQAANAVVFLRGVGQSNSQPAAQPGISMNVDGIYLPRELAAGSLFDLERVEVLPGPQGTLYGRNSAGGAVNLVTRKPGSALGGEGFIEAGNYSAVHGFGAVDLPVNDMLAVRAALDVNKHDGYLSNGGNDADSLAGRLSVSFRPNDDLSALLQYTHTRDDGVGPQDLARGTDHPPYGSKDDPYFDSFPNDQLFRRNRGHIVTANVSLRLNDDLTLTYLPGYMQSSALTGHQFSGVAYGLFDFSVEQYSQELRLANNGNGRVKWLAGLFWFRSNPTVKADVGLPGLPAFSFVRFNNHLKSYAAFGEATYSVTDRLRLTAGGRYSIDSFDGTGSSTPPPILFGAKATKYRFDWKFGGEYDVAPHSMLYATAQSGYLTGGYTQADFRSTQPKTFKPENLLAFTAGIKNRFLDNRLQINNEVFYYSYDDYQLQTVPFDQSTGTTTFLIVNVPKATIYGDQLDLAYSVTRNTDFNLSAAYLHAEITRGLKATPSYKGFQLPNAPELTVNASLEQRFPLSNGAHITARVATTYNKGYWTVFTHDMYSHQDAFTKTDLNLTYYSAGDRWNFGAFARNLENSAVYFGADSPMAPGGFIPTFIDAPRTYGVRAGFNF